MLAQSLSVFKHLVEQPGGHSKAAYLAFYCETALDLGTKQVLRAEKTERISV